MIRQYEKNITGQVKYRSHNVQECSLMVNIILYIYM